VLQEHLIKGYTIQQQRFEANAKELEKALTLVRQIASKPELEDIAGKGLADIVSRYAQTFLILQRYDEGLLTSPPVQEGGILPTITEARSSLLELKKRLIERKEATDMFAREPKNGLEDLLGNLDQSVFGDPAYPSIESKAAHLLYFVIKNHPFNDGNKRSGAFLFVDFLNKNKRLFNKNGHPVINDNGLAALTLLVAESCPTQKETMISLIMNMLANP
jgi:prophage maintenance system killer protein